MFGACGDVGDDAGSDVLGPDPAVNASDEGGDVDVEPAVEPATVGVAVAPGGLAAGDAAEELHAARTTIAEHRAASGRRLCSARM
jgi:hypothetical protein